MKSVETKGILILNRKFYVAVCGFVSLFLLAWGTTSLVMEDSKRLAYALKVEVPVWLDSPLIPSLPLLAGFLLLLCFQRHGLRRFLLGSSAAVSLAFCFLNGCALLYWARVFQLLQVSPTNWSPPLQAEMLFSCFALSLNVLNLYFCLRSGWRLYPQTELDSAQIWQTSPSS